MILGGLQDNMCMGISTNRQLWGMSQTFLFGSAGLFFFNVVELIGCVEVS